MPHPEDAKDDERQPDNGEVTQTGIRRQATPWLHVRRHQFRLELLSGLKQCTVCADKGANAGVCRADRVTPYLQRPHTRNLQMLMRGNRITKPGIVTHVYKQNRFRKRIKLLGTVGVLESNGSRELGAVRRDEQRLNGLSSCQIRMRQVLHLHPFANRRWNRKILAERHQVPLTIGLLLTIA